MEQRSIRLEIEVRRVEMMEYATKDHAQILLDALSDFYLDFSVNYRTKSQLRKMTVIHSFLNSPEH